MYVFWQRNLLGPCTSVCVMTKGVLCGGDAVIVVSQAHVFVYDNGVLCLLVDVCGGDAVIMGSNSSSLQTGESPSFGRN